MKKLLLILIGIVLLTLSTTTISTAATTCVFATVGNVMYLTANCTTDATIVVPDGFMLDGQGFTITATDPAGGHFRGAVIKNGGSVAHVKNLVVTTSGLANVCDSGSDRLRGIMFDGASGSITHNTVVNINQGPSGCQEGNAIEVRNAPFDGTHPGTKTVTISGNTVRNYQKNGITGNGDVYVVITDNTVEGAGSVDYIAQNGIQVGYGGMGEVKRNTVSSNWYTGASWSSTGLLVFEASGVMVQRNSVSASQIGVGIETWCYQAPSASNNQVVQNTIDGAEWGVSVASYAWSYSTCNPNADNNKVVNNTVINGGDTGVSVGAYHLSTSYAPSAKNNKVINNTISGFTTPVDDSGTKTKAHANTTPP